MFSLVFFVFLQLFSKNYQTLHDYSKSFGEHRNISTFRKFGPPYDRIMVMLLFKSYGFQRHE